jgi:ParB family chromosome partitioning protein
MIKPNPHNTRTRFEGEKFDELVKSIEKNGVIEPIIIRKKGDDYEIVAGERRFRATLKAHHGNGRGATIPALIRDLSDEEALEIMAIENLQRENLNELEEARAFRTYLTLKGDDAAEELASKIGVDPRYVRRRVRVLSLPKKALEMWEKREVRYGHLEQFLRLGTKQEVLDILDRGVVYSVTHLRQEIDSRSPAISKALFDTKQSGCQKCAHNSARQRSLFGEDFKTDKPLCLSPSCFAKRQADHLTKTWDPGEFGTPSFRWRRDLSYETYAAIYGGRVLKACKECDKFVTLLEIDGQVSIERACLDKSCYRTAYSTKADTSGEAAKKEGPPEWHATFFREEFYKQTIPAVCETMPPDNYALLHVALVAILEANRQALDAFARKATAKEPTIVRVKDVWKYIEALGPDETRCAIKEATVNMVLQGTRGEGTNFYHSGYSIGADMRHVLAAHLGIDLARDWRLNEEYLKKKTVSEILSIGHRTWSLADPTPIFDDPKGKAYLLGTIKRKAPEACKKTELMDLILKSGVDLAGRVPDEILKVKEA